MRQPVHSSFFLFAMFLLSSIFSLCASFYSLMSHHHASKRWRGQKEDWHSASEMSGCFGASRADGWGHPVTPVPTEAQSISYSFLTVWLTKWLNKCMNDWTTWWQGKWLTGCMTDCPAVVTLLWMASFLWCTVTNWMSTEMTDKSANHTASQWPCLSVGVMISQLIR